MIVGLGNPGREYAATRHNVGFMVVDACAAAQRAEWGRRREFEADVARVRGPDAGDLFLLKPLTFMNESGRAVGAFCRFYKIEPPEVVVIYDEVQIPTGLAKLTVTGSAGGHNGIASLLEHVGDGFRRLRIGVGPRQPPQIDLKDYVLGQFTPEQLSLFQQHLPEFLAGLDLLITQGVPAAMNRINRRSTVPDDRSSNEEKL